MASQDDRQFDENFFSPFWVVSSMMISQTFGVVLLYVVGGGQIWTDIPAHFILVCVSQNESFIRVLSQR